MHAHLWHDNQREGQQRGERARVAVRTGAGKSGRVMADASLVSERTMHSQIDAYVGGDGGWASGEVDPDEDDYPPSGGSNGDDFGAGDY